MKMECELLQKKFNNDTTTTEGVGFIESMLGGNSTHRAGALKAGLREGLLSSASSYPPDGGASLPSKTNCRPGPSARRKNGFW